MLINLDVDHVVCILTLMARPKYALNCVLLDSTLHFFRVYHLVDWMSLTHHGMMPALRYAVVAPIRFFSLMLYGLMHHTRVVCNYTYNANVLSDVILNSTAVHDDLKQITDLGPLELRCGQSFGLDTYEGANILCTLWFQHFVILGHFLQNCFNLTTRPVPIPHNRERYARVLIYRSSKLLD